MKKKRLRRRRHESPGSAEAIPSATLGPTAPEQITSLPEVRQRIRGPGQEPRTSMRTTVRSEKEDTMTNPFPNIVNAMCTTGPDECWTLVWQEKILHNDMTKDQAEYAAHAINQYEKIMTMLKELEWEGGKDWDEVDGHAIPTCPCCGGRHIRYGKGFHNPECKLAALLYSRVM